MVRTVAAAFALVLFLAAPGKAQDGPEAPEDAPPAAPAPAPETIDKNEYAARLVANAAAFLAEGKPGEAYAYLKHVRTVLGDCAYVREHTTEIDAAFRDAEDGVAEKVFGRAAEFAEKNPAKAKEKLDVLRAEYGGSRFVLEKRKDDVLALEAKVRTALWPGKDAWRGDVLLPAEGVIRLAYPFDRVEELADFDTLDGAPKVGGGELALKKLGGAIRHRLPVDAGGDFKVDLDLTGTGRLWIALEGDEADLSKAPLVLELEASTRLLKLRLRQSEEVAPISSPRESGRTAASPWIVRIERSQGKLRASVKDGGVLLAHEETVGGGPAFSLGLSLRSGDVKVEALAFEAPLPEGPAGDAAAAERAPLPKKVWIPLQKKDGGLEGWHVTPKNGFSALGETLRQEDAPATLASKELEGRALERYTLTVDVRVAVDKGRPAKKEPYFAIAFKVGSEPAAWVFSHREMRFDGVEKAHYLERLAPDAWHTLTLKVDEKKVEAFLGAERVLGAPVAEIRSALSKKLERVDGVGFVMFQGPERVELRAPRIRLE